MDNVTDEYLTVMEIATRLRLSKMSVYRILETGVLPASKFGRSVRVKASDFADYLESSQVAKVDAP